MLKKILVFLPIVCLTLTLPATQIDAGKEVFVQKSAEVDAKSLDPRAEVLKNYLSMYDSPLQNNSEDFIDAADKYKLDWRLLPAIAGVESTFGKFTPGGFNGWGWGVYGNQAVYFKSWKDSIFTVSEALKTNYIDKGLNSPSSISRVYSESPYWGGKVNYFITDLNKFTQNYKISGETVVNHQNIEDKTVTSSAKLSNQLSYRI